MTSIINPNDIKDISDIQENEALLEIKKTDAEIQKFIKAFVEKKVADCIIKYNPGSELHTVFVDKNYEYNDEGYCPDNVMVWLNDHNTSCYDDEAFSLFQKKLDESLGFISEIIRGDLEFDVETLKAKYGIEEPKKAKKAKNAVGKIGKRYNL